MKVILREEVENLGNAGDLVSVRSGFARNYLFPRSLAVRADERNVAQLAHDKRTLEARRKRLEAAAKTYAGSLEKVGRIVVSRACGVDGRLFGSVTAIDIAAAFVARGVEVDRKGIQLGDPLKQLGDFDVAVKAGQGIKVTVKVSVEPDEASAALIAKAAEAATKA
jgi:large subunit ribosomal protein L9